MGAEGLGVIAGPMQLPSHVPRWARQVAGAVAYLHSRSIVHRDLKPGNILLRWNADGGFDLEVADLGSAKMMVPGRPVRLRDKASVDGHRRNVATVMEAMTPHCCTLPYAAPEMWFGGWEEATSVYGYSLDVWSYGAVIFEVITLGPFAPGGAMQRGWRRCSVGWAHSRRGTFWDPGREFAYEPRRIKTHRMSPLCWT